MSSWAYFFALCRAEPGAIQNSGADQVGRAGFGRRQGEAAAARHGLQQHLRKLPVLPFVLLQGWVSEAIACIFMQPISHLLPMLIDVVFEQSDDTEVLVCSVSGVLKSCGWIWKPQVCGLVSTSLVNLIQPADAWWTPTCCFGRFLIVKATESYLSVLALRQNWGFKVSCTVKWTCCLTCIIGFNGLFVCFLVGKKKLEKGNCMNFIACGVSLKTFFGSCIVPNFGFYCPFAT